MAAAFALALTRFLEQTSHIIAVYDLATKWRVEASEMTGDPELDLLVVSRVVNTLF